MSLDYLSLYGNSFQSKIITNLITNKPFLAQIMDVLSPDYFDSDANKYIVSIIMDYFKEYNDAPTTEVFKAKIQEIKDEILKSATTSSLKDALMAIESTDLEYVRDEFINFCKNKKMKEFIMASVELVKTGKYEEVEKLLHDTMKAGADRDLGLDYSMDIEDRYSKQTRKKIVDTEWPVINDIVDGGLGEGDLGVLVGAAGSGKSWALVSIGLHALSLNKTVLHFTLELNEGYTAKRYDSRLTGIAAQNLKYHIDEITRKHESQVKGQLRIKYYPTKSANVITLKSHLNKLISFGINPDLIIVDYADLLRSDSIYYQKAGSYYELGSVYEDLRGLAGEYQIPIWTASQAQRGAANEEIITGDQIAESYKKVMIGDLIISVSRKIEDKLANTARWHIIKNRYGPDALTFPSKMDASVGKIEIYAATSVAGAETRKEMRNSNELVRKELANRYTDFE